MLPSSRLRRLLTGLLLLAQLLGHGVAAPHRHGHEHGEGPTGFQKAAACAHPGHAAHLEKGVGVHEACTLCTLLHQAQAWSPAHTVDLEARETGTAAFLPVLSPPGRPSWVIPGRGPPSC